MSWRAGLPPIDHDDVLDRVRIAGGNRIRRRRARRVRAAALVSVVVIGTTAAVVVTDDSGDRSGVAAGRGPDTTEPATAPTTITTTGVEQTSTTEALEPTTTTVARSASLEPVDRDRLILFLRYRGELARPSDLMTIRADGTGERVVKSFPGPVVAVLSPDQTRIAYLGDPDSAEAGGTLRVMNADGSGDRSLAVAGIPAWSPDGRLIAYAVNSVSPNDGIYVIGPDGGEPRRLTPPDGSHPDMPTWSPDGRAIAFRRLPQLDPNAMDFGDLWMVRLDGTDYRPLTKSTQAMEWYPDWSPDGRRIAFAQNAPWDEDSRLATVDVTSGAVQVLPSESGDSQPRWSPTGRHLVFLRQGEVYRMAADGRGVTQVTRSAQPEHVVDW